MCIFRSSNKNGWPFKDDRWMIDFMLSIENLVNKT